ncbi:MAG: DUF1178 family protein [Pseudomonadota bacterium]
MIRYALVCAEKHEFESWFQSAAAYEALAAAGHVTCAVCGNHDVKKKIMAPRVAKSTHAAPVPVEQIPDRPLSTPASPAEQALRAMREKIQANSEDVGQNFAREARAIHSGEAPERAIYGQANPAEAKSLIEDGVPVLPLPFDPARKTN